MTDYAPPTEGVTTPPTAEIRCAWSRAGLPACHAGTRAADFFCPACRPNTCKDDGGVGVGAGHTCLCVRKSGHPLDSERPHGCPCGAMWAGVA